MNSRARLLLFALLFSTCQPVVAELTVRVDASAGAPRIMINGKPVRGRMFWGAPGTKPIVADTTGRTVSFDFRPAVDEPGHGTIHFRFGAAPGPFRHQRHGAQR